MKTKKKKKKRGVSLWLERLWKLLFALVCLACLAGGAWLGLRYTQCLLVYTTLS